MRDRFTIVSTEVSRQFNTPIVDVAVCYADGASAVSTFNEEAARGLLRQLADLLLSDRTRRAVLEEIR